MSCHSVYARGAHHEQSRWNDVHRYTQRITISVCYCSRRRAMPDRHGGRWSMTRNWRNHVTTCLLYKTRAVKQVRQCTTSVMRSVLRRDACMKVLITPQMTRNANRTGAISFLFVPPQETVIARRRRNKAPYDFIFPASFSARLRRRLAVLTSAFQSSALKSSSTFSFVSSQAGRMTGKGRTKEPSRDRWLQPADRS